jgi:hypothetical protein
MTGEVLLFLSDRLGDWNLVDDIFLSSVLNTDVTHTKWNFLVHDHALGVCTSIHDVDLGDYTDCSDTLRVELSSHLEAIRSCHIGVGWHDTKDNGSWVTNVSMSHGASNLFDVVGLISDSNTCDTWQIDKCQVWAGVGVNLQNNGLVNNVLVGSAKLVCEAINVVSDF